MQNMFPRWSQSEMLGNPGLAFALAALGWEGCRRGCLLLPAQQEVSVLGGRGATLRRLLPNLGAACYR